MWAARLAIEDLAKAGELRLLPEVEILVNQEADEFWLRGPELTVAVQKLPVLDLYQVVDGMLVREGGTVPEGRLREGNWVAVAEWCKPVITDAALSGRLNQRMPLALVLSSVECESNGILTDYQSWKAWAASAPQIRLKRLKYAMNRDGAVFVRGTPLAPIAGVRYFCEDGIARPAGFDWSPRIRAGIVRKVIGLRPGDIAVFSADSNYTVIQAVNLVTATRSGAKLLEVP